MNANRKLRLPGAVCLSLAAWAACTSTRAADPLEARVDRYVSEKLEAQATTPRTTARNDDNRVAAGALKGAAFGALAPIYVGTMVAGPFGAVAGAYVAPIGALFGAVAGAATARSGGEIKGIGGGKTVGRSIGRGNVAESMGSNWAEGRSMDDTTRASRLRQCGHRAYERQC